MNAEQPLYDIIVQRGFECFQQGLQSRFKAHGIAYRYEYCRPTDNPALSIHLDTERYQGCMIAWTRGTCHLEVLDCASRRVIFEQHCDLPTEHDFHEKLAELALLIEGKLKT